MDNYFSARDILEKAIGTDSYFQIKSILTSTKAADVVEVVRCRECKHYREFHTKKHRQIMRLCYRMGKHDMEYSVKPDDFCSYGQRKEAEQSDAHAPH